MLYARKAELITRTEVISIDSQTTFLIQMNPLISV
jgi:hypothetical protein